MRYIKFTVDTMFCGTEDTIYEEFSDDTTDAWLDGYCEGLTRNNAEGYEYLVCGWGCNPVAEGEMTEEEYQDEIDNYYAEAYGVWEEISQEEFEENT